MNVLIVDDEQIIRRGLERVIQDFDGYRVLGTADDGETALKWLSETEVLPDLIITDILMQYIDGLDLIARVNELYPGVRCTILSGHEEFHSAKKALDLKVLRYITKPVEPKELFAVLEAVREEIKREQKNKTDLLRKEQLFANASPYVRDKLLTDLLEDRLVSVKEMSRFAEYFPFSLEDNFHGGVIRVLKSSPDTTNRDYLLYSIAVKQLFSETILVQCRGFVIIKDTNTLVFGLSDSFADAAEAVEQFTFLAESVLGIPTAVGVDQAAHGLLQFGLSVANAYERMELKIKTQFNYPLETMKNWLEECISRRASIQTKNYNDLIVKVTAYMEQHYGDSGLSLQRLADLVSVHPNYLTQTFRKQTGLSCMQYLARLRMERAKRLLNNDNLKIYQISEIVGYENPLYFSSYFKKWVGMNPSDFKKKNEYDG